MAKEIDTFEVNGIKVTNIQNDSPIAFFGVFCSNGYIHETPQVYGVAHFAEHLFFKGTSKRTWKQINRDYAKIGANANAYTSSDEVCYFVTTMNDKFDESAEILCDMFFNSNYDQAEMDKERNVILEEKKMYDDDPSYDFSSKCGALLHPAYGHDAIGTEQTISSLTRDDIVTYLDKTLGNDNLMFVFCGNLSSEKIKSTLSKLIPEQHRFLSKNTRNATNSTLWNPEYDNGKKIRMVYQRDNIEQAQVVGIMTGLSSFDALKSEEIIALACLGGGDYSMMYETLREEMGLCYALGVSSDAIEYPHVVASRIYGLVDGKNVNNFIDGTDGLFKRIRDNGLDKDLFDCAKNSVSASVARAAETSRGKAGFLMKRIFHNNQITVEQYVNKLQSVKLDVCNEVARAIFVPERVRWAAMVDDPSKIGE